MAKKQRAPRNKTIILTDEDRQRLSKRLKEVHTSIQLEDILDSTICQDMFTILGFLPEAAFDLVFADPPYNLTKDFNGNRFKQVSLDEYEKWLESWVKNIRRLIKPSGSIYVCGDWRSSAAIHRVLSKHFIIQNRITWEREKGRGANTNWKNNSEDIWFATVCDKYTFNVNDVKIKRRVLAPYTDENAVPKDWSQTDEGRFRITHPSNVWTDLTVPFWSMPENTDHPTQKPEKLLAKVILASSNENDVVFDPFLGSGTTSVVAKKLHRHYVGIEIDPDYCCLAEKRIELADNSPAIQGYTEGVFWERNTLVDQQNGRVTGISKHTSSPLFDALKILK
jgi:site-specific DNA-methyltransferase (adenine-specific)